MSVEVVCLDAADTLFTERSSRAALYAEVFAAHGVEVPVDTMAAWMAAVHDELPERVDGGARYSEPWFRAFVGALLRRGGSDRAPEPVRATLADTFTRPETYVVFADTFPALDDLTDAGLRLALVSNWSDKLPGLLEALGLRRYFEVLAVSQVVGHDKPDARLFHHALARLDVAPERALHVGDHPVKDVAGARGAGLAALLLDRDAGTAGGGARGDDVIASLDELPGRLRGDASGVRSGGN